MKGSTPSNVGDAAPARGYPHIVRPGWYSHPVPSAGPSFLTTVLTGIAWDLVRAVYWVADLLERPRRRRRTAKPPWEEWP